MLYFRSPLESYDAMQQNKRSLHYHVIEAGLIKTRAPTCKQLCLPNGSEHSPTVTLQLLLHNRVGREFPVVGGSPV